jgi:hypothetical protein
MRSSRVRLTLAISLFVAAILPAQTKPVTFNRDIAPIIYNSCSSCHRPGEAAPFSLLSFADVSKHGRQIAAVTASRLMPPWKADASSYPFRDERRLSAEQLSLLGEWVKQGMPEGNRCRLASRRIDGSRLSI